MRLARRFIKNFNIAKNLIKHQVSPMNENIVARGMGTLERFRRRFVTRFGYLPVTKRRNPRTHPDKVSLGCETKSADIAFIKNMAQEMKLISCI